MENTDEPKGITSITSYALQEQVSTQDRTMPAAGIRTKLVKLMKKLWPLLPSEKVAE